MTIHPIEVESYRILESRVDLSAFSPLCKAVVARVIHASADLEYATSMVLDEETLQRAQEALKQGAPILTDVEMVKAGISTESTCYLSCVPSSHEPSSHEPSSQEPSSHEPGVIPISSIQSGTTPDPGITRSLALTRSAAGMRRAALANPTGACFVVGCAPTALFELVRLVEARLIDPILIIGMPVGFVGATESKEALRQCRAPSITNIGEKGGSAVASAAVNALLRTTPSPTTSFTPSPTSSPTT